MKKTQVQITTIQLIGLMAVAYLFSFMIRMIWVWQFQGEPSFYWNGQLMINTNDGYFFAAGVQKELFGMHEANPRVFGMWEYGAIFFTTLLAKITPLSVETLLLYMPAVISSLVVVPVILIARLYNQTLWGFFAALLGSIAVSYYNRTMVGYYDTDMFSAMAPMFILYFLMKSTIDFDLKSALYAALFITIYPFLYDQGKAIVYAMGMIYAAYMIFHHRKENTTYLSLILVFFALIPLPLDAPFNYVLKIALLFGFYLFCLRISLPQKQLIAVSAVIFLLFMVFGNVFGLIFSKISLYLATGTKTEGLHFYSVTQTVREAGQIPFDVFAQRISGSVIGLAFALLGYAALVVRYRAFLLALPLIGIGIFALWGGLRFTVYAVPVAALSAVYLFVFIGEQFKNNAFKYALVALATAGMLYPNIVHIIGYKVPTVMTKDEVEDLEALNKIAKPGDYTLAWWDYGYPIWYYGETSTLIDGGKHNNDNFIISKIMQTTSPQLAANLARLAVETYESSGYKEIADTLFKNQQQDQIDPNLILSELELSSYKLPAKTRDVYVYLPFRMMQIFPTVAVFGNLDLQTGKPLRQMVFYPGSLREQKGATLFLSNGIVCDMERGELMIGDQTERLKQFVITENTKEGQIRLQSQNYYPDGRYVVVFLKSYGQMVVMDTETFQSMYVQMFMLGKYDSDLFEPVVTSPYSRIYRLKK